MRCAFLEKGVELVKLPPHLPGLPLLKTSGGEREIKSWVSERRVTEKHPILQCWGRRLGLEKSVHGLQ